MLINNIERTKLTLNALTLMCRINGGLNKSGEVTG